MTWAHQVSRTHTRQTLSILACYYIHLNQFIGQDSAHHELYVPLTLILHTVWGVNVNTNTSDGYPYNANCAIMSTHMNKM